jgi:type 1 glutamine amidotransferase
MMMRTLGFWAIVAEALFVAQPGVAADPPKRLLLVTHSGGYMHDSVLVAERVLKEIGPSNGFEVTCWRYTADPDARVQVKRKVDGKEETAETSGLAAYSERFRATTGEQGKPGEEVTKAQCGRVNAQTLKNFDVVLFFTTGAKNQPPPPLTDSELKDLSEWVRNGGGFAATHCGSDTLYDTPYGELIGGYFDGHPWHQKIRLKVEDPNHPAAKGFTDGAEITDEMYQFRDPYSRGRLHVILSIDNASIDVNKDGVKRPDKDFAVAWCHEYGKGRVFYTSLGHRREVWRDPRFQEHLMGGLKWAAGVAPGDATPSAKLSR